jgi:hypothetical protein
VRAQADPTVHPLPGAAAVGSSTIERLVHPALVHPATATRPEPVAPPEAVAPGAGAMHVGAELSDMAGVNLDRYFRPSSGIGIVLHRVAAERAEATPGSVRDMKASHMAEES